MRKVLLQQWLGVHNLRAILDPRVAQLELQWELPQLFYAHMCYDGRDSVHVLVNRATDAVQMPLLEQEVGRADVEKLRKFGIHGVHYLFLCRIRMDPGQFDRAASVHFEVEVLQVHGHQTRIIILFQHFIAVLLLRRRHAIAYELCHV